MQYKRWRVVAGKCLVNAVGASAVLFVAACGGPASDAPAESDAPLVPQAEADAETGLTLPAVWSTRALDGPVQDVALSTGPRPLLAIAFEGRGFQLFNLEGERLGEPIGFGITDLAGGQFANLDGAAVTLFPGVDREGRLNIYLHGSNLPVPVEIPLPINAGNGALGLCAGAPAQQESEGMPDGAVMRLGYWLEGAETTLEWGTLGVVEGAFTWSAEAPLTNATPLGGCRIPAQADAPLPVSGTPIAVADLERPDGRYAVTLTAEGQLLASGPGEGPQPVTLREGMSVRVPLPPVAMDAQGAPLDGGYPFGLIVLAGETAPDVHQAVFVDTTPLVAPEGVDRMGVPAASAE
ncbi:MAG: hypothetical protein AAGJ32_00435 [Pseudomonadota bacterium]